MPYLTLHSESFPGNRYRLWPNLDHIPEGVVTETQNYIFELFEVDDSDTVQLSIDGQLLEALRASEERSARWRWSPGFFAGIVSLSIIREIQSVQFDVVVDPAVHKLTRHHFNLMIEQILEDTFQLFSLSSFKIGVSSGDGTQAPPIARIELLSSLVSELTTCIQKITENPVKQLNSELEVRPIELARQTSSQNIAHAYRQGRYLKSDYLKEKLPPRLKGFIPRKVSFPKKTIDLDIIEHQAIKNSIGSWSSWLNNAANILRLDLQNNQKDSAHWATRCESLSRQLRSLVQQNFFQNISDKSQLVTATSIFSNIPEYHKFLQIHHKISLGIASITGDFLDVPIARTYDLYELWCFFRVTRVIADLTGAKNLDLSKLVESVTTKGQIKLKIGACSVRVGPIEVAFQRSYREYWLETDNRGSFSRKMIPDISLIRFDDDQASLPVLYILDAKYRVKESLNDAIASIHMYRDALVEDTAESGVKKAVEAAFILCPQVPEESGEEWKEIDIPARLFQRDYRNSFKFGLVSFHPKMSDSELISSLNSAINIFGTN